MALIYSYGFVEHFSTGRMFLKQVREVPTHVKCDKVRVKQSALVICWITRLHSIWVCSKQTWREKYSV